MSETFLGFRTFWWAKTNAEKGCWTWEITMYFLNYAYTYPSNFFFRATFLMCVLQVEPLPSTVIAVLEHSGTFERRCQTKPRHDCLVKVPYNFLWNEITWVSLGKSSRALSGIEVVEVGGWAAVRICMAEGWAKVNSEENGFVDKPIDLRVVAAPIQLFQFSIPWGVKNSDKTTILFNSCKKSRSYVRVLNDLAFCKMHVLYR